MAASVLLQSLGNGVLWDSSGNALNSHLVYVYQRGTTTQVQVYQDSALTQTLAQPLTTGTNGASPGGIPGYVASGQALDLHDATAGGTQPAEALAVAGLAQLGTDGTVGGAQGTALNNAVMESSASIDLCRPWSIYAGVTPGSDITTQLQAAINYIGTNFPSTGAEVYFSVPGTYNINGALQTGTALAYTYNGQILFPALGTTSTSTIVPIKIRGMRHTASSGGASRGVGGVVLASNATAGWVFDCIPAFTAFGAQNPWTQIKPIFQDIIIQAPSNPQCGGINAITCAQFGADGLVVQGGSAPPSASSLTGTLTGVVLPQSQNAGGMSLKMNVRGFPNGVQLSEHVHLDYVSVYNCINAFTAHKGGHVNKFVYVDVEGCSYIFNVQGGQGLLIEGFLDMEESGGNSLIAFSNVNTQGLLKGKLNVWCTTPVGGMPLVFTSVGTNSSLVDLDIANLSNATGPNGTGGWKSLHPSDSFQRVNSTITTGAPGQTWPTYHPWEVIAGSFQVASNQLTSTNGTTKSQCMVPARNHGENRIVAMGLTTGASLTSTHFNLEVNKVKGGAQNANGIAVGANGNSTLTLFVNGTSRATFTGALATSTSYTLAVRVLNDALGRPSQVTVYLNGTKLGMYTLTAAESALILPGTIEPGIHDGVSLFEQNTVITNFNVVSALPDPPCVASGTATLAAGSVTVANTSITASSIIRLNRQAAGGTLGELSVSLTAGTSFTINSNSGTDTSTVYYEVVSY